MFSVVLHSLSYGVISHVFIGMSAPSSYKLKESIDIAVVVLFPRGEEVQ